MLCMGWVARLPHHPTLPIIHTSLTCLRTWPIVNTCLVHLCAFTLINTPLKDKLHQAIFMRLSSSALFWACEVYQLHNIWRRVVVVTTTAQLHSTKPGLRFCTGSTMLAVCWRFAMVRISYNGPDKNIPPKQFIIIIINNT